MRIIKFRGKRVDNGEWVYGYYVKRFVDRGLGAGYYTHNIWNDEHFDLVKEETVGQFTGLKDCNGAEIYDGDKVTDDDEVGIVEWSEEDAMFVIQWQGVIENFGNVDSKILEVAGKIYDRKC